MKKTYIFVILLIGFGLGWGVLNHFPAMASADETAYDLYEYRPLITGSSWTYNFNGLSDSYHLGIGKEIKVLNEEEYNGVSVKVIQYPSGWLDYFEESDEGVKRHKHVSPDGEEYGIYFPPAIQYPRYMKIGDVFERKNVLKDYSSKDNSQIGEDTEMFTFTLLGVEDVHVPLGEFKDCLKTIAEWKAFDEEGKQNLNNILLTWDAKGVGTVKAVYYERINGKIVNFFEGEALAYSK